jgi:protein-tyrosine phosphatase
MIDLHAHVLPGIDDGPASIDAALELLRAMVEDGVRIVAATPHVRDDFPTTPQQITAALSALTGAARAEGLEIEVLPGAEIAVDRLRSAIHDGTLPAFALAGNPRYLLVEFPYYGWPLDLEDLLRTLGLSGIRPVLAHPERNPAVQTDPARVVPLVRDGALIQLTASSLVGQSGTRVRRTAFHLLDERLAHLVGSDSHGASTRRASMSAVRGALDEALAEWLTVTLPEAIVRDATLPQRPDVRRASRRSPLSSLVSGGWLRRRGWG